MHPLKNCLRIVHLTHRNHRNPIWKWSGFYLKNRLSPRKTQKSAKSQKIHHFALYTPVQNSPRIVHCPSLNHKNRISKLSEIPLKNALSPKKTQESAISQKCIFLLSTPLIKIVLEWPIKPMKTINTRFWSGLLDDISKIE